MAKSSGLKAKIIIAALTVVAILLAVFGYFYKQSSTKEVPVRQIYEIR